MKNITLLLIAVLITGIAYSQKIKFGVVAGPDLANNKRADKIVDNSGSSNDVKNTFKPIVTFKFGAVASVPMGNFISFRPELTYIGKGWETHHDFSTATDYSVKVTSNWIEMPLNFVYNIPAKNGRFFIGVGPSVAFAFAGKMHNAGNSYDIKIRFGNGQEGRYSDSVIYANRFDIGANALGGYEFRNGFFVELNYSYGFMNFRNDLRNNPTNKNIVVGLSIGYMFRHK
jgi:hypothetical protein